MEKGLMKVLKDGAYVGVHPETESSQVTDFVPAVSAINAATIYDNAGAHNAIYRGKYAPHLRG